MDDGDNYHHRMYVLENNSNNPIDEYKMHGQISDDTNKWAIDGSIIKYHNHLYMVWSGWEGDINIAQNLYIAEMSDPFTISSKRRLISSPDEEFERGACRGLDSPYINEGPCPFYDNDDLYILYSGSGSWDVYYCLIALRLNGKDPMKDEWIKDVICIYNGMVLTHKNNEIMPLAATWMELEIIMLSEESQKEKDKHMIPHVWNLDYDTDESI